MNLELTKEQYITLIKTLNIASWTVSSLEEEEFNDLETEVSDLEQLVLSKYKDFEADDYVYFDKGIDSFMETNVIEEQIVTMMESYDDTIFWDELTHRMARRDLIEEYGEKKVIQMDPLYRMELEEEFISKYSEEFSVNGINRLYIDRK